MKKFKAYTLLEVLISALVLGFLGVGSMFMVSNSTRVLNAGVKMSMANSNVQAIMREISNDIKEGIVLSSNGGLDLTIEYEDATKARWYVEKYQLMRTGRDGTTKKFLLHGARDIKLKAFFKPEQPAVYWKAYVEFRMLLDDGNTFEVGNIANTFYCRHDPAGFIN
ncbi:MAG: hypothetical protein JXN63_01885 [Candidatus Delongbacteria bacterium]|nr:hypothetical protein [Candidatus Delongbacteria bacterium]